MYSQLFHCLLSYHCRVTLLRLGALTISGCLCMGQYGNHLLSRIWGWSCYPPWRKMLSWSEDNSLPGPTHYPPLSTLSSLLPPNLSYPQSLPQFFSLSPLLSLISNILHSSLCIRWVTIGARIFSPTSLLKVKLYPITCISFSCCLCV